MLPRDLGYEVDIYERSSNALMDRGAGIVVLPITERYFAERSGETIESASSCRTGRT